MLPLLSSEKMFSFLFPGFLKTNLLTIYFLYTFTSPSTLRYFPLLLIPRASKALCLIFPVMIRFIHYKMTYDTNIYFELLHLHYKLTFMLYKKSLSLPFFQIFFIWPCYCWFYQQPSGILRTLAFLYQRLPFWPLLVFRNQFDLCGRKVRYWRLLSTKKTCDWAKGTFNFLTLQLG